MAGGNSQSFDDLESLKARLRERRLSNAPQSARENKAEAEKEEKPSKEVQTNAKTETTQTVVSASDVSSFTKAETSLVTPKKVQQPQKKSSLKKLWWLALPVAVIILAVAILVPILNIKNNTNPQQPVATLQSVEVVSATNTNYQTYLLNQHFNLYQYKLKKTYSNGSVSYSPLQASNLQIQGLTFINEDLELIEFVNNAKIPVVYNNEKIGEVEVSVQKATIQSVNVSNIETTVYQKGLFKFSTLQVIATDAYGVQYMLAPQDYKMFMRANGQTEQLQIQKQDGFVIPEVKNTNPKDLEFYVSLDTENGNFNIETENQFKLENVNVQAPKLLESKVSLKQTGDNINNLFYSSIYGKENGVVCNGFIQNLQVFEYYQGGGIFEKTDAEINHNTITFQGAQATYTLVYENETYYLMFNGSFQDVANDTIQASVMLDGKPCEVTENVTIKADEVKNIETTFIGQQEKPIIYIGQTDLLEYIKQNYTFKLEMRSGNILTYHPNTQETGNEFVILPQSITIDTVNNTQIFMEGGKYFAVASAIQNAQSKMNIYFKIADMSNVQGSQLKVEVTAQKQEFRANLQQANIQVSFTDPAFAGLLAVEYANGSLNYLMAKNVFQTLLFKGKEYTAANNELINKYLVDIHLVDRYTQPYRFVIAFNYTKNSIELYVYDRVEKMQASNSIVLQIAETDWVKKISGATYTAALYNGGGIYVNTNTNINYQDFSFYTIEDIIEYNTHRTGTILDDTYTVLFKLDTLPTTASFTEDETGKFIYQGKRGNVQFTQAGQYNLYGTVCVYKNGVTDLEKPTFTISQAPTLDSNFTFNGEQIVTNKKISLYIVVA